MLETPAHILEEASQGIKMHLILLLIYLDYINRILVKNVKSKIKTNSNKDKILLSV